MELLQAPLHAEGIDMAEKRKKIIILGAGGRDFHNFNMVYRNDPSVEVVAITATQIPGIDKRTYPAVLAEIGRAHV